jgi:hypothetical protein
MKLTFDLTAGRRMAVSAALAAVVTMFAAGSAAAKTPDGRPPAGETICSGLSCIAFGLCNTSCDAQDCDAPARPSCPALRKAFEGVNGSEDSPCHASCGKGKIGPGEQ